MMRINHNISALTAHRNLSKTTDSLSSTLEKLSSGFRINRAADDAAGLAISEKLRSQISGLVIAQRNSQDGISLIQTAEGALDEVHTILRRVRDLTQMAANGDKTDLDRSHYQHEINQLLTEIDRISDTTEYNTMKLLDGSIGSRAYEKADPNNISNSNLVSAKGVIETAGEYTVSVVRPATQAKAYMVGNTFGVGTEPDIDEPGGMFTLLGAANSPSSITLGIELDGKYSSVTMDVLNGGSETIAEAIQKINDTLKSDGMEAHAFYDIDVDSLFAGSQAGISIVADNFGSKHDIKLTLSNDTTGGVATVQSTNPITGTDDEILATTALNDPTTDFGHLNIDPLGSFTLVDRNGTSDTFTLSDADLIVNGGDGDGVVTLQELINHINTNGTASVTASWNTTEHRFEFKDTSGGTGTFQIMEVGVGTTAEDLGIFGSTYENEFYGVRVSRTKDFILEAKDPDGNIATLRASLGDRSTYFAESKGTNYPVLSSGVDPDGGGVEVRGVGGIKGITFTLNEKVVQANEFFVIDSTKGSLMLQVGPNDGPEHRIEVSTGAMDTDTLGLLDELGEMNVSTQENAMAIIDSGKIDLAIDKVSTQRAELGAIQNRLNHTISNLSVAHDNLQYAESRIRDLDMASGMMEMTRLQILMQSGTAMMSQSNIIPQSVLQLFG